MKLSPRLPDESVNLPDTHPLRNAAELIAGVVVLGALAYGAIAYFVDFAVWMLPPETEARLGPGVLADLGESGKDAHPRQAELQTIVDNLARGWPGHPYRFRVMVLPDDQPNAFAVPGGAILVTKGLLEGSDEQPEAKEMELAFVLGHELGHFKHRDHLRGLGRGVLFGLLMTALGTSSGNLGVVNSAGTLGSLRFNRGQESAADRFGLGLVWRHYGHIAGTFSFFQRRSKADAIADKLPGFASTHPRSSARIAALRRYAEQQGWHE